MIEAFIVICLSGAIGLVVMEYRLGAPQGRQTGPTLIGRSPEGRG